MPEIVTICWKYIKHTRHTGGLVIKLPPGYDTIDFIRNYRIGPPEKQLEKLIGCFECPAYLKESPGEEGVARPIMGERIGQEGNNPATIDICCEGTERDARYTNAALCRKRFLSSQKIEVNLDRL